MRVVEPSAVTAVDGFAVASWPDVDGPAGSLVALRLPLPVAAGTPYVRNGWQSWSAPVVARLGDPPAAWVQADGLARRHPWPAAPLAGDVSYDVLATDGYVAGVVEGGALLVARPASGELLVVRESPGPHPPVWSASGDAPVLLDRLLRRCGGRSATALRGWSSWSAHRRDVTAADVSRVVAAATEFAGLQVVSVDDGWAADLGDWDRPGPGFPRGIAATVDGVRAAGLRAGVWLAPWLAGARSRLAQQRPQWLLRDARGAPVVAMRTAQWAGDAFALDTTRPDVREWIADVVRGLVAAGVDYLKLDFLYAAALPGCHARPAPGDRRVRDALRVLRDAAGPRTFLVGCGCPLWPAIGLVDAMRVGPDVDDRLLPEPGHPEPAVAACLDNAMRSSLLRAPFHRRLWVNDPDAVQLAPVADRAYGDARLAAARRAARGAEMLFWSDRLDDLDRERVALWAELAAAHGSGVDHVGQA